MARGGTGRASGVAQCEVRRYVLMNAGEPLNEVEAEQMMKEADKDGDGTIDYEGEWGRRRELVARPPRLLTCPSAPRVRGHDDRRVLQAGSVRAAAVATGGLPRRPRLATACPAPNCVK